ncbi:MAG: hypothetical protein AAB511_00195 [Patescibacteria group bacterium]
MNKIISGTLIVIALLLAGLIYVQYQNGQKVKDINILSKQVLEQMATARQKGTEAGIKAQMYSLRVEAEMVFDKYSAYSPVCKNGFLNDGLPNIEPSVSNLLKFVDATDQSIGGIECVSSTRFYAISIKTNPPIVFEPFTLCIDSTGYAGKGKVDKDTLSCISK